jgi:hypothetical protein
MVWFFERNGTFVRFETRDVDERPGTFELVILDPDGTERVETFTNSDELAQRQDELQSSLCSDGWNGPYGRFL